MAEFCDTRQEEVYNDYSFDEKKEMNIDNDFILDLYSRPKNPQ